MTTQSTTSTPAYFRMPDNAVTVTANAAANTYTIAYNANGVSGSTASQSVTYDGGNVTLRANGFSRSGYTFQGWSRSSGASNTVHYNGNTAYAINTIVSNAGVANTNGATINLYAVWKVSTLYMQTTGCKSLTVNTTTTMVDSRDNQSYTVYRWPSSGTAGTDYPTGMAGYCIMTKDLSLGYVTGGSITKGADLVLTTATSAAAGTITARTGTSGWNTANSDSNLQYINGAGGTYDSHSYYSFGAAQKVCPKGWRPPTLVEYTNIVDFMGSDSAGSKKIRSTPYSFVYGGFLIESKDGGVWYYIGSRGLYWSSTVYAGTSGNHIDVQSSSLNANVSSGMACGLSVRCVAAP